MMYRAVLVGFGSIAETTHLAALEACGVRVVAIVEPHPMRQAAALKARPDASIYATLEEALKNAVLDIADICTPPDLHYDAALTCLNHKLHVLCEKPLATEIAHTERLFALSKKEDLVLACVHNWTQAPIFLRAQAIIADGNLGQLREIRLVTLRKEPAGVAAGKNNWRTNPLRAGGGILYDHGWHGLSIMFRAFGQGPQWVEGATTNERYFDLGVEDTVKAQLNFGTEKRGFYEASWAAERRRNEATYIFERGRIDIADDTLTVTEGGLLNEPLRFEESLAAGGYRPKWTAGLIREFISEIQEPGKRNRLAQEAVTIQQTLGDIYRSHSLAGERVWCSREAMPTLSKKASFSAVEGFLSRDL